MCSISKSIICHRIETIRNISICRCILTNLYRISRRIKLHINVGQKKKSLAFTLKYHLCYLFYVTTKLQFTNSNRISTQICYWCPIDKKQIDNAAEQHMRSMLPIECTISTFRTQINVIFCRMRMCYFFFLLFRLKIFISCGICRTTKNQRNCALPAGNNETPLQMYFQ